MLLTFILLGVAIVAVWLPDIPVGGRRLAPWQPVFLAAVSTGLASGVLRWPALVALAAIWAAAWASTRSPRPRVTGTFIVIAAVLALAFPAHLFPGFTAPVVAADLRLSPHSAPMTLEADFDKGAAGLILLVYCCRRVRKPSEWPLVLANGFGVGAVTAVVVISIVVATGAIHLDPKLPAIAPAWLAINLMLTCLMEEAFFRGILQDRLARAVARHRRWRYLPVAVASVLFGLVHFSGGLLLIVAATIAGVGYGMAYARTGRIEAAVLAHFSLNAIHFLGFTYPYAVR